MTVPRSQDDVLAGVITVVAGGSRRQLPTMKIRAARAWKAALAQALQETGTQEVDFQRLDSISMAGQMASDRILEMVVLYDSTNALGGRDWIEDNMDDQEVYTAFRQILAATFPFVTDLRSALGEIAVLLGAQTTFAAGALRGSTSGPSPSGDSTPEPSTSD